MKLLVGVAGPSGAGKDVVARQLVARWRFRRVGFSDALKDEVATRFRATVAMITLADEKNGELPGLPEELRWSWTRSAEWWTRRIRYALWEERSTILRAFLQEYGMELRRQDDPAYWTKQFASRFENLEDGARVVAPDVRFPNEADLVRRLGGWLVKIRRLGHAEEGHASEMGLAEWPDWDLVLQNDGSVEALEDQVDRWVGGRLAE